MHCNCSAASLHLNIITISVSTNRIFVGILSHCTSFALQSMFVAPNAAAADAACLESDEANVHRTSRSGIQNIQR
jgi:hypothetical protein